MAVAFVSSSWGCDEVHSVGFGKAAKWNQLLVRGHHLGEEGWKGHVSAPPSLRFPSSAPEGEPLGAHLPSPGVICVPSPASQKLMWKVRGGPRCKCSVTAWLPLPEGASPGLSVEWRHHLSAHFSWFFCFFQSLNVLSQ